MLQWGGKLVWLRHNAQRINRHPDMFSSYNFGNNLQSVDGAHNARVGFEFMKHAQQNPEMMQVCVCVCVCEV